MKKLYYGGDIITMTHEGESVEAVLVEDGIIQEVGNVASFENLMNDSTIEKVDLNGHTMLPGFVDPHGHISIMGTVSVMADLSACESLDRKSTRLNSSHVAISYAVFCLKKKK